MKPPDPGPLLQVRDLKTYFRVPHGLVRAVDGVSLDLAQGRTLGVVGESGCGKSVLSKSIMGLLPRTNVVREGEVVFEGRDLTQLPPKAMRAIWGREIAMVFQDPMTSLNPVMRIGRQVAEPLRHHLGMKKRESERIAVDLLRSVGIPEPERRLREYPHQLSGGMRQRVTIAMALACSPKLLLADEPTTALDVTIQAQILNLLADQQTERRMAMILVTHDLGVVAGRTDEIAVMYAAKIVERAPTSVLFSEMRMPYTEALLHSIPKLDQPSHTRQQAIPGRPPDLLNPPSGCRFAPRCPYAQRRCHEDEPPLTPSGTTGHAFACWYPVGTDAGSEALERNVAAGLPSAMALIEARGGDAADRAAEAARRATRSGDPPGAAEERD